MGYIEKNLVKNEDVQMRAHLHWVVFAAPTAWLAAGIFLIVRSDAAGAPSLATFGAFLFLFGIGKAIESFINYRTSEFGVTNKRVLLKTGLIRRKTLEILLPKIEGVEVDQGIMGRVLNFGSIVVSGTGGRRDPYHRIAAPLDFRHAVQELIEAREEQMMAQA